MDKHCGTCVAGGVHMLGLHVTTAPRRHDYHHPVLESFTYVPYTSSLDPELQDEFLVKYSELCADCSLKGLQTLLNKHGSNGLKNRQQIETLVAAAVSNHQDVSEGTASAVKTSGHEKHHSCLDVLKAIFAATSSGENVKELVDDIVQSKAELLKYDSLLGNLLQTEYFKPCLDIVIENTLTKNLKVLEVGNTVIVDIAHPLLNSHPLLNVSYIVATTDSETTAKLSENEAVSEVIKWQPCDALPGNFKKAHLVIANNIVHKQVNVRQSLLSMVECVEDGGFLLVQEVTKNFHIALPLDGLCSEWECDDIGERTCGIYCDACKWRKIFSEVGFEVIYEVSDNIFSTVFLLKKHMKYPVESQIVIDISDTNCGWVDDLKCKMSECQSRAKGENLWLKADGQVSGILGMVNCLRQEPGGDRIR